MPQEAQTQQLQELETQGTAYGKHFSLQGLTGALQTYVDNAEKWHYDRRAVDHWCKVVGGEQKLLPVHVVNEYCRSDRPFEPCPSEWESTLPRTLALKFWDSKQSTLIDGTWFIPPSSKDGLVLGLNHAVLRYNTDQAFRFAGQGGGVWESADLKALQSLWKTRTEQLEALKSQLLSTPSQNQRSESESKSIQKDLKYEYQFNPEIIAATATDITDDFANYPASTKTEGQPCAIGLARSTHCSLQTRR